jgi:hypothetical protein
MSDQRTIHEDDENHGDEEHHGDVAIREHEVLIENENLNDSEEFITSLSSSTWQDADLEVEPVVTALPTPRNYGHCYFTSVEVRLPKENEAYM